MALQQNTDHIQTTHIGSLPRPHKLLDILKAKYGGQPYDEGELNSILTQTTLTQLALPPTPSSIALDFCFCISAVCWMMISTDCRCFGG